MQRFRLERRTFLRAAGASIALPWLEAMVGHEGKAAAATPPRFAAVYFGNGVVGYGAPGGDGARPNHWHCAPGSTATDWALSRTLAPLAPHKALVTYLANLHPRDLIENDDGHWSPAASFLTGQRHNSNAEGGGERLQSPQPLGSLDQAIARVLGGTVLNMAPFPVDHPPGTSSEPRRGAGVFLTNVSWRSQTEVAPRYDSSWAIYDALFASTEPGAAPMPDPLVDQIRAGRKSVLDLVHEQAKALESRLGAYDREKMERFATSIREVELSLAAEADNPLTPAMCAVPGRESFDDGTGRVHLDLGNTNMARLLALAFQCERTRVATWMIDSEHNYDTMRARIPGYSGPSPDVDGHLISHKTTADDVQAHILMNDWHMRKFLVLCDALAQIEEANGKSMLQNSVILFGSPMADGWAHGLDIVNAGSPGQACVLVGDGGGLFTPGRFVDADGAHHANLLLALAQRFGVQTDSFGHSDGIVSL
jgi:hypothetical protein